MAILGARIRHKRGIGFIYSLISGIAGITSKIAQGRQIKVLQDTFRHLVEHEFKMTGRINDISGV